MIARRVVTSSGRCACAITPEAILEQRENGVVESAGKPRAGGRQLGYVHLAQSIGRRDANIIKADLPRGLRIPTHLALFLTVGNSLEISGYEKRGDTPGSAIACSRHDNEDIRVASARNENLAAIEPIAIALSHGSGPQRRRI